MNNLKMIESLSKFESCGIPFFRFRTLNFLSNFLDRRSFNFDDFASMVELNHTCSTIEAKSSKLKDRLSKKLDKKFNVLKRKKAMKICSLSTPCNEP